MSFENKFKERKPNETINLLYNFFQGKNCIVKKVHEVKSEVDTYSCVFKLFYRNICILKTSGKGLSKELAEASGLSELYERFCNLYYLQGQNYFFTKEYLKKKNNYKILTYEEAMPFSFVKEHFNSISNHPKKFLDQIVDNQYIGYEYTNLEDNSKIYIDHRLMERITTSNGMAAGNTLEEAINQGMSEIFERYVFFEFYKNKIDKYFILEKDDIQNNKLKNIIEKIENNNNKIFFIDFSYNFNLPVIGCVCINRDTNSILCNFGSFLYVDIAIERTLTELYQGMHELNMMEKSWLPYPKDFFVLRFRGKGQMGYCESVPENLFDSNNKIYPHSFNYNIFIKDNLTNKEILQLNKKIAKEKKFNIYLKDNSLTNNFFAIHLICDQVHMIHGLTDFFKQQDPKDKMIKNQINLDNINLIKDILYSNITSKELIKKYSHFFTYYNQQLNNNIININKSTTIDKNTLFLTDSIKMNNILTILIQNNDLDIKDLYSIKNTIFYQKFKLLYTIRKYKEENYNTDYIYNILSQVDINISKEFIDNCFNIEYIIDTCFIQILKQYYPILLEIIDILT